MHRPSTETSIPPPGFGPAERRHPGLRRVAVAAIAAATLAGSVMITGATTPSVVAATPSGEDLTASTSAASWLALRVNDEGFVPNPADAPNVGATLDVALALAASGTQQPTFDRIAAWARAHPATVVGPNGPPSPGNIGQLLMVAAISGDDPSDFGGINLYSTLAGTLDDFAPGLYGVDDPTYDGVFRQSLAILGLQAHGAAVPSSALIWLADQQCGGAGTPAAAVGGWQAYRANAATPCTAPDLAMFTGPETNSTAFAIQALVGSGVAITYDAVSFLASAREADGGFDFLPGAGTDPNSTSLVIQALVALGQDPTGAPWTVDDAGPYASLRSWQLGCDAAAEDRGALASPFSSGAPDEFATRQAPWGLAGQAFPLGPVTWTANVDRCAAPITPTTPTTSGADPSSPKTPTPPPVSIAAVNTNPRLAG